MRLSNIGTGTPNWITQDPTRSVEYYSYLNGKFRNGQKLQNDYQGPGIASDGTNPGALANYIFNGDPTNVAQWSECQSGNIPGDRRGLISVRLTNPSLPGNKISFTAALVASNLSLHNGCPTLSFAPIRQVADTARYVYCHPLPISTRIDEQYLSQADIQISPNPVSDNLNLITQIKGDCTVTIYAATGVILQQHQLKQQTLLSIDVAGLPPGFYTVNVKSNRTNQTAKFMKR